MHLFFISFAASAFVVFVVALVTVPDLAIGAWPATIQMILLSLIAAGVWRRRSSSQGEEKP